MTDKNDGTVNMMKRRYERVRSYGKKEVDAKSVPCDDIVGRSERSWPCVLREEIMFRTDELAGGADIGVLKSCKASCPTGSVDILKVSTVNIFLALVRDIAP